MGTHLPGSFAPPHGSSFDRRRLLVLLTGSGALAVGAMAVGDPAAAKKKKKKYPLVIKELSMVTADGDQGDRFDGTVVFTGFGVSSADETLIAFGTFKGVVTHSDGSTENVETKGVEISLAEIQPGEAPTTDVDAQSYDLGTLQLLLGMTWAEILGSLFRFEAKTLPAPLGSKNKKVAKKQAKAVNQAMDAQEAGNVPGMAAALNALAKTY